MACGWGLLGRFPRSICGIHQRGLCPHSGLWHLPGRMREAQRRLPWRRGRWAGGLGRAAGWRGCTAGVNPAPPPQTSAPGGVPPTPPPPAEVRGSNSPPHTEGELRSKGRESGRTASGWGCHKHPRRSPKTCLGLAPHHRAVRHSCLHPCLCWGRLSAAGF